MQGEKNQTHCTNDLCSLPLPTTILLVVRRAPRPAAYLAGANSWSAAAAFRRARTRSRNLHKETKNSRGGDRQHQRASSSFACQDPEGPARGAEEE